MTEAIEYNHEIKQIFNNTTYYVRATTTSTTLYVEVEQLDNSHKWNNRFVKSHIEEMTSKTGNYISFDRFCEMIKSALQRNNDGSVYIDLLTWQDLEILKARKAVQKGQKPSQELNATHRTKNKRYIILTYVAKYDRVHYPLCLKLDDNSTKNKSNKSNKSNNKQCAKKTAHQLLTHSISSSLSSSSSPSSLHYLLRFLNYS